MHRVSVGLALMLAACGPRETGGSAGFRAAAAPIYSNAVFDVSRLDGNWVQVAAFAGEGGGTCRTGGAETGGAEFARAATGIQVQYQLCLSGKTVAGQGALATTGPGRFAVTGKTGLRQDWWVLWVDEGYRTMAIGTPSGAFGFVLNRGADMPQDRLNAAREVFDFNGYANENLRVFNK